MSSVQKINEQAGNSVIGHYINGQAVVGSGRRLEITNPAYGPGCPRSSGGRQTNR